VLALNDRKLILAALEKRDAHAAGAGMRQLLDRIRQRYFSELSD
jgi:DNA-binding FadR family transcriptional regulator